MNHSKTTSQAIGTEEVILGLLLGVALTAWAGQAYTNDVHLLHTAVGETFWVAVYLTIVVSYCGFKMPVFFAKSPFWSTWALIVFSGHISLLFDSFAVVMLLAGGVTFINIPDTNNKFNKFAVKSIASFSALTVGGGFYLGELWGLPWFITNGMDNPLAGLPVLAVLTPYCFFLAFIAARFTPVKMKATVMDREQTLAAAEFAGALLLIILTHSPFLSIGILLIYTALRKKTVYMVEATMHEVKDGAANALGLIIIAVIVLEAGWDSIIQPFLTGSGLLIAAAISSPFAGAMAPKAQNLQEFYVGWSSLAVGATLFVSSSLVAIMVFTDVMDYKDLPRWMKLPAALMGGRKKGTIPEKVAYTLIVAPMAMVMWGLLSVANHYELFPAIAHYIGVTMETSVSTTGH